LTCKLTDQTKYAISSYAVTCTVVVFIDWWTYDSDQKKHYSAYQGRRKNYQVMCTTNCHNTYTKMLFL